jgi:hypothetical protein
MKKIISSVFSCFIALSVFGQTNTFPSTGNAGVGTLSPSCWFAGKVFEIKDTRPIFKFNSTVQYSTLYFTNTAIGINHYGEFHVNHNYNAATPDQSRLIFNSYPVQNILTISSNGKVGIGTANPDQNARLSVDGKILAEELQIIVDVPADYVFDQTYRLMPLLQVSHYIKENKHLPNIPSATEIQSKGWVVGEMSNKLLEKIEELTLYMIQLKDENEELKKENMEILERLKKLELK